MFWIVLWIYTFFVVIVWALFILIRIHSLKFKNFQTKIVRNIRLLCFSLTFLTVLWYILVFIITSDKNINSFSIFWNNLTNDLEKNIDPRVYY